jgi:DNA-binding transcriptional LysR family regulator
MPSLGRVYKEVTLQQLRSFLETARQGSLAAAAAALGLAQPTVWAQVHALERHFGTPLVKPSGRGCQLTEAGRLLAELVGPSLAGVGSLKRRFQEARAEVEVSLVVATTSRILVEDLPECVAEFSRRYPRVHLTLRDLTVEEVIAAVERGEADLGVTVPWPVPPSPWLLYEPACELDILLLTPKDHPLARRRRITPEDLCAFPIVNAAESFKDRVMAALLDKLGLFRTQPRRVEVSYVPAIRRYVALGLGIGLIAGRPSPKPPADLHERSMSRFFPRVTLYLVWRQKIPPQEPAGAFVEIVKETLNRKGTR